MREWQIAGGKPCPRCGQILEKRKDYYLCWTVTCDVIQITPGEPEQIILRLRNKPLDTMVYN
jgi:hypothetical protein